MVKDIFLNSNGGKGMVITTKEPITKRTMLVMSFSSNEEVIEFHKQIGQFVKENCY